MSTHNDEFVKLRRRDLQTLLDGAVGAAICALVTTGDDQGLEGADESTLRATVRERVAAFAREHPEVVAGLRAGTRELAADPRAAVRELREMGPLT